jgi:RimJ/RimL family protein N-acetyltransferase
LTIRNYEQLALLYQPPYGDRAIVLKESGALIGACGYVPSYGPFGQLPHWQSAGALPAGFGQPEFGLYWAIAPGQQRRGHATEAGRALIDYIFAAFGLGRIVATTAHDNAASIGVMRKLGMTVERNPLDTPPWFQTVGVLTNPRARQ